MAMSRWHNRCRCCRASFVSGSPAYSCEECGICITTQVRLRLTIWFCMFRLRLRLRHRLRLRVRRLRLRLRSASPLRCLPALTCYWPCRTSSRNPKCLHVTHRVFNHFERVHTPFVYNGERCRSRNAFFCVCLCRRRKLGGEVVWNRSNYYRWLLSTCTLYFIYNITVCIC